MILVPGQLRQIKGQAQEAEKCQTTADIARNTPLTVVEETVTPNGNRQHQFVKHWPAAILPLLDGTGPPDSQPPVENKTLIEVPAGTRETNESLLETARRELAERPLPGRSSSSWRRTILRLRAQ
jgi:hypothetical protein